MIEPQIALGVGLERVRALKTAAILILSNGKPSEITQAGIGGRKIIIEISHANARRRLQLGKSPVALFQQQGLGISLINRLAGSPDCFRASITHGQHIADPTLSRRQVDSRRGLRRARAGRASMQASAQDHAAKRMNRPVSSATGMTRPASHAAFGMRQRTNLLESGDAIR